MASLALPASASRLNSVTEAELPPAQASSRAPASPGAKARLQASPGGASSAALCVLLARSQTRMVLSSELVAARPVSEATTETMPSTDTASPVYSSTAASPSPAASTRHDFTDGVSPMPPVSSCGSLSPGSVTQATDHIESSCAALRTQTRDREAAIAERPAQRANRPFRRARARAWHADRCDDESRAALSA